MISRRYISRSGIFCRTGDEDFIRHVTAGLQERGIINREQIGYESVRRSKYAYVVYDLNYQQNIGIIQEYVDGTGIKLCGRFAEFEYLNMDACVERAMAMAVRLNEEPD